MSTRSPESPRLRRDSEHLVREAYGRLAAGWRSLSTPADRAWFLVSYDVALKDLQKPLIRRVRKFQKEIREKDDWAAPGTEAEDVGVCLETANALAPQLEDKVPDALSARADERIKKTMSKRQLDKGDVGAVLSLLRGRVLRGPVVSGIKDHVLRLRFEVRARQANAQNEDWHSETLGFVGLVKGLLERGYGGLTDENVPRDELERLEESALNGIKRSARNEGDLDDRTLESIALVDWSGRVVQEYCPDLRRILIEKLLPHVAGKNDKPRRLALRARAAAALLLASPGGDQLLDRLARMTLGRIFYDSEAAGFYLHIGLPGWVGRLRSKLKQLWSSVRSMGISTILAAIAAIATIWAAIAALM